MFAVLCVHVGLPRLKNLRINLIGAFRLCCSTN